MVLVIWEFIVRPSMVRNFELAYGPDGPWAELFEGFPGYRGTALLRDTARPNRFLTVDRWETIEHRAAMLAAAHDEYRQLDQRYSALSESETDLGVFDDIQAV